MSVTNWLSTNKINIKMQTQSDLYPIAFGTSGYRGIIGETFTSQHIIAIAYAIANYCKYIKVQKPRVLVGYDTRTGNSPSLELNSYTHTLVHALTSKKINVDFCDVYTPTPVISYAVRDNDYTLGIILTASHNPPNYNGIKINDAHGAPAPKHMTFWIETEANKIFPTLSTGPIKETPKLVTLVNYSNAFIDHLQRVIKTHFKLPFPDFSDHTIIDPKCGSAIDIWKTITSNSIGTITWLNDTFSDQFNFSTPNPTAPEQIKQLSRMCKKTGCMAIANDPDADRHVMIDELGQVVSPEKIAAIVIDYCATENIAIDSVSTTLANSFLIKKVCTAHSIQCHETNIGFKYFTPYLLSAYNQNKLAIGVESSGGFSVSFHTFDKCGFLPALLVLSIMKKKDTSLSKLAAAIDKSFSTFSFVENSMPIKSPPTKNISHQLKIKKETLAQLFTYDIENVTYNDGLKITFSNCDWVLCRASGTEPLIRIYAESAEASTATRYCDQIKTVLTDALHLE
jgi:phosphomannomutase